MSLAFTTFWEMVIVNPGKNNQRGRYGGDLCVAAKKKKGVVPPKHGREGRWTRSHLRRGGRRSGHANLLGRRANLMKTVYLLGSFAKATQLSWEGIR